MAHRVIVVDSPYEPEVEANMICVALRERYLDFTEGFAVVEKDGIWIIEFNDEINGIDLRVIREYAEGFCDGIAALRG